MTPRILQGAKVLLVTGLVVAFAFQIDRARDRLEANRALATVEARTTAAASGERIPVAVIAENLRLLREAREQNPADGRIPLAQGGLYLIRDRCEPAVPIYREALELEPRPEIYLNLGRCLLRLDRRTEAEEAFLNAVTLHSPLLKEVPVEVRDTIRRRSRTRR